MPEASAASLPLALTASSSASRIPAFTESSSSAMPASFDSHDRECTALTNVAQADATFTVVKTFADRLIAAREAAGLNQVELAKKAKVSPGAIGNYESGTRKTSRELLAIATALGVNPEWLKTGKGQKSSESPTRLAHQLGLADVRLSSPVIEWGVLTMKTLPKAFKVAAPDDSMSPRLKRGQLAEFETGLDHRPGDGVLVRDLAGDCFIRRCRKVQGAWQAYAEDSDVHQPIDIGAGQAEIIAVLVGVHARWS